MLLLHVYLTVLQIICGLVTEQLHSMYLRQRFLLSASLDQVKTLLPSPSSCMRWSSATATLLSQLFVPPVMILKLES